MNNKIRFKVHSIRTLTSPYSKEDKDETTLETIYYLLVNMRDLPANISMEVNPRKPNMKTDVGRDLLAAVSEPETDFYINNRGIVISAKSLSFDTSNFEVSIDLGNQDDPADLETYGILDGGHTYTAIMERREQIPDDLDKYVRIEVITNIQNITRVSDARNTSREVSDAALFNLDERFQEVRDAIKDESYADKVSYKDNEGKEIHVVSLLRLMYAFDIDKFPDDSAAPVQSFSGKAQVFKRYSVAYTTPFYQALTKELPRLVLLYDTIERELPNKYKDYKQRSGIAKPTFGRVRGVENVSEKDSRPTGKTVPSTFSRTPMKYQIASGYIFPIFGAFRALLHFDASTGKVSWDFDPLELWREVGIDLAQNTFDGSSNPQLAGKDKLLWLANYRIVGTQALRKMLQRR